MPRTNEYLNALSAFRTPNLADVDRAKASNALLRDGAVDRPFRRQLDQQQENRLGQAFTENQKQNARGIAANYFASIAQSERPDMAYQQALNNPDFQSAIKFLGQDPAQFTFDPTKDTPDSIRATALDHARALGAQFGGGRQNNVHSTFYGKNGNMWTIMADGTPVDTGVPASQFAMKPVETGYGIQPFNPASGVANGVVSPGATAAAITTKDADRARAVQEAKESVTPAEARTTAQAKAPRIEAAQRRLNRVAVASKALGAGGGPYEGRLKSLVGAPEAQELEAANAQLINELTALTRIPGVGSQSDLEQRLAQLALPQVTQSADVRKRSIDELELFLKDLDTAIGNVGAGNAPAQGGQAAPETSGDVIDWNKL